MQHCRRRLLRVVRPCLAPQQCSARPLSSSTNDLQAALARSSFVRLRDRAVITLRGPDSRHFLQGLTTNDINQLTIGKSLYTAFLTSKGRILLDAVAHQLPAEGGQEVVCLDVAKDLQGDALKLFRRYKLRSKVDIVVEEETEVIASLPKFGQTVGSATDGAVDTGGVWGLDPRTAFLGYRGLVRSLGGSPQLLPQIEAAKKETKEEEDKFYHIFRSLLGVAEGSELRERIPLECNVDLLHGVSFSKGCYLGQELIARTQFKGNIRKRIFPILFVPLEAANQGEGLPDMYRGSYTALTASTSSSPVAAGETKDVLLQTEKGGTGSKAGTILRLRPHANVGLAMLRLQSVHEVTGAETSRLIFRGGREGEEKDYKVIPLVPEWWPQIDAETGKLII